MHTPIIAIFVSFFWGLLFLAAASLYEKYRPFARHPAADIGIVHYPNKPLIATASVSFFISCGLIFFWVSYVLILFSIFGDNEKLHLNTTDYFPHFQIIVMSVSFNMGIIVFTFIIICFLKCSECNHNVAIHDLQPDDEQDEIFGFRGGAAALLSALFRQKFRCSFCGQAYAL
jgi:hypothetical protein